MTSNSWRRKRLMRYMRQRERLQVTCEAWKPKGDRKEIDFETLFLLAMKEPRDE